METPPQAANPYDVKYINPFVNAVIETFQMMLKTEVKREKIFLDPEGKSLQYYAAQIGLSGEVKKGVVIMSYSKELAGKVAESFLGSPAESDEDVMDAIGEIVNIVSGSAKRQFVELGLIGMKVALPTVTGGAEVVHLSHSQPRLCIAFGCNLGPFVLQFMFS
jgi:chemotaxis protein CheX